MVQNLAWRLDYGGMDASTALHLVEEELLAPKRGQVLVQLHAAALNYRDYLILQGRYGSKCKELPVPLSDGAGQVIEVGEDVTKWKKGDKVIASFSQSWMGGPILMEHYATTLGGPVDGVLQKYRIFEASGLVTMPPNLSYEEAATLPCAGVTAFRALYGFQPLQAGQTVLVQGTGGVSVFALQLAAAAGARVIVTSSSDDKLEKAKKLGATDVINYRTNPDWEKKVLELTHGQGVDKIIEVGGPETLGKSLQAIKADGAVYVIGHVTSTAQDDWTERMILQLIFKSSTLQGLFVGSRRDLETLADRFITAKDIHPVVDTVFEFKDAVEAYKHLQGQGHFGKVVIKISA